jgi:hypothetical protein
VRVTNAEGGVADVGSDGNVAGARTGRESLPRRPRRRRAAAALLAAALGAAALTACSSGDDGDKKKRERLEHWAAQLCTPEVVSAIDASRTALTDVARVVPGETPEQLRGRLSADVARVAEGDTRLAAALDRAGAPDVKDGAALRADLTGELRASAQRWNDLRAKIDALPVDAQNTFATALRALDPDIQALGTTSRAALGRLHSGETGQALAAVPGCSATAPTPPPAGNPQPGTTAAPEQPAAPSASASTSAGASASPSASGSASASPSASDAPADASASASAEAPAGG